MKRFCVFLLGLTLLVQPALAQTDRERAGAIIGGIGGAILGAQFGGDSEDRWAASVLGGLIGSYAGAYIGRKLDERDRQLAGEATLDALDGASDLETVWWDNPQSGNSGGITPTTTFVSRGQECRIFDTELTVDGETAGGRGQACRMADGSWRLLE
ncbi:MAG: RT0821/Lpp0805 family surface protein [Pseudomonadota bacterium]